MLSIVLVDYSDDYGKMYCNPQIKELPVGSQPVLKGASSQRIPAHIRRFDQFAVEQRLAKPDALDCTVVPLLKPHNFIMQIMLIESSLQCSKKDAPGPPVSTISARNAGEPQRLKLNKCRHGNLGFCYSLRKLFSANTVLQHLVCSVRCRRRTILRKG